METTLSQQELSENIGTVTRKELIEREIIFDSPKKDVVLKVINIQNEIEINEVKSTSGNILVTGYLNNCIMYTTIKRPEMENNNQEKSNNEDKSNNENSNSAEKHGYTNTGNDKSSENNKNKNKSKEKEKPKPSCGVVDNSVALDGVLRHTTVWIPFKAFIPSSEVQEDDICTVTSAFASNDLGSSSITPIYEEEYDSEETISIMRGKEEQKFIRGIINKTLIELTVNIKRCPKK